MTILNLLDQNENKNSLVVVFLKINCNASSPLVEAFVFCVEVPDK